MSKKHFCSDCQHDRGKHDVPAISMRRYWTLDGSGEHRPVCGEHQIQDRAFHAHMIREMVRVAA